MKVYRLRPCLYSQEVAGAAILANLPNGDTAYINKSSFAGITYASSPKRDRQYQQKYPIYTVKAFTAQLWQLGYDFFPPHC